MSNEIVVEEPKIKNGTLISRVKVPTRVKRYFDSDRLYIRYENVSSESLKSLSPSILNIPVVANIAHFAWMKGIDIHVKELDKGFSESLNEIKPIVKRMYPSFKLSEIHVDSIVENHSSGKKVGLLFTGGVDSLSSYVKHRDEKPLLIRINLWGDLVNKLGKERSAKSLSDFAKKEGIKIVNVETNVNYFLNRVILTTSILLKYERNWWSGVAHGLSLLGICAPISIVDDMREIIIASSQIRERWGSLPIVDSKIHWSNIKAVNDDDLRRQEKIGYYLRDFLTKNKFSIKILSCEEAEKKFTNCNQCEKCLRTIVGLTLEGIDPNNVGFKANAMRFKCIQKKILNRKLGLTDSTFNLWIDLQKNSRDKVASLENIFNLEGFFNWLRDYDLSSLKLTSRDHIIHFIIASIYGRLPIALRLAIARALC